MKKNEIIPVLAALCVLSVAVMVLVLNRSGSDCEFTPPPFEQMAESGIPEVPEGLGYQELDVQVFRVGLTGEICIREGGAEVWFTNPRSNPVWLRLRVLDEEGQILGQTGILKPGEYIRWVALTETVPGTPVVLKVMAYEPDNYHSAGSLTLHTCIAAE